MRINFTIREAREKTFEAQTKMFLDFQSQINLVTENFSCEIEGNERITRRYINKIRLCGSRSVCFIKEF